MHIKCMCIFLYLLKHPRVLPKESRKSLGEQHANILKISQTSVPSFSQRALHKQRCPIWTEERKHRKKLSRLRIGRDKFEYNIRLLVIIFSLIGEFFFNRRKQQSRTNCDKQIERKKQIKFAKNRRQSRREACAKFAETQNSFWFLSDWKKKKRLISNKVQRHVHITSSFRCDSRVKKGDELVRLISQIATSYEWIFIKYIFSILITSLKRIWRTILISRFFLSISFFFLILILLPVTSMFCYSFSVCEF